MMADQKGDRRKFKSMELQLVPVEDEGFVRFFKCPTDDCGGILKLLDEKQTCDHCETVVDPDLSVEIVKEPDWGGNEHTESDDSEEDEGWTRDPFEGPFQIPDFVGDNEVVA